MKKRNIRKILMSLMAFLLTAALLAGCGGLDAKTANYAREALEDEDYYEPAAEAPKGAGKYTGSDGMAFDVEYGEMENGDPEYDGDDKPVSALLVDSTQKLIYTCDMKMETTEFEKTMNELNRLIVEYKGFIEADSRSDNASDWYYSSYKKKNGSLSAYVVIRIPTENYEAFLSDLEGQGRIRSKNSSVENITRTYRDTETTIKALKTQEERLLEMLKNCETIEDMITVEARLTEVQTQLQIYESRLSGMDMDVAYSTVNLTVTEVLEYTPEEQPVYTSTFLDRLKNTLRDTWDGFLDFLENFLFFLIRVTPILLVLGIFFGLIVLIIVSSVKSRRKRRAKKQAQRIQNAQIPDRPVQVPPAPQGNTLPPEESRENADRS